MERVVLVIEDNQDFQVILRRVLRASGYRSAVVENGQEGLAYLDRGTWPDVILCDVDLPVMSGSEFVLKLKDSPVLCHIPVVLISNLPNLKQIADNLGVAGHIPKDSLWLADVIVREIERLCPRRQLSVNGQ